MIKVQCKFCTKEFLIKPSHHKYGWGVYCSNKCKFQAQFKGKIVNCSNCGKEVYRSPKKIDRSKSKKYFCTKSCQTIWRNNFFVGDKSVRWTSGISTYRNILLRTGEKPKCKLCDVTDSRILSVHHKDHIRTNNDISNLVWLCFNCHYLLHHDEAIDFKMRNTVNTV